MKGAPSLYQKIMVSMDCYTFIAIIHVRDWWTRDASSERTEIGGQGDVSGNGAGYLF